MTAQSVPPGAAVAGGIRFPLWAKCLVAVLALVALALVSAALLLLAGARVPALPPPDNSKPLAAADEVALLAAGVTTLLAVATVVLAMYTREAVSAGVSEVAVAQRAAEGTQRQVQVLQEQVDAIRQQAAVAQAALEASYRPILVDGVANEKGNPVSLYRGPQAIRLTVGFRNVGNGLAILTGCALEYANWSASGGFGLPIAAPGEQIYVTYVLTTDTLADTYDSTSLIVDAIERAQPLIAVVSYSDQDGARSWLSKAHLQPIEARNPPRTEYAVRQVGIHHPGDETPFVMSGPADLE